MVTKLESIGIPGCRTDNWPVQAPPAAENNMLEEMKSIQKKLDQMAEQFETLKTQVESIKTAQEDKLQSEQGDAKLEDKSRLSEQIDIKKIARIVKTVSQIVGILADGTIAVYDGIKENKADSGELSDAAASSGTPDINLNISGILKSTQKFIDGLAAPVKSG